MLRVIEHGGWRAHSDLDWWLYDTVKGNACITCKGLHGTHYRGDDLPDAFYYHIHLHKRLIKPRTHPNCFCRLHRIGTSKTVLQQPFGWLDKKPKRAELPAKVLKKMTLAQRFDWWKHALYARETFKGQQRLKEIRGKHP